MTGNTQNNTIVDLSYDFTQIGKDFRMARNALDHAYPGYRNGIKKKRRFLPNRKQVMYEPMESRVLLSADTLIGGLPANFDTGINAIVDQIQDLVNNDTDFTESLVPGILQDIADGNGDLQQVSPTLEQSLRIYVDLDRSNPNHGTSNLNSDDAADIYDYLNDNIEFPFNSDFYRERALDAMDINDDGFVDVDEAFRVLVGGQITDYLENYDPAGKDVDDLKNDFNSFLSSLDQPTILNGLIDLDVSGSVDISDDGEFAFQLNDLKVTLFQNELIDLGLQADEFEITLLNSPTIQMERSIEFEQFVFGFNNIGGGVVQDDFFFATPEGFRIGVNIDSQASFDVNVGFLGAQVTNGDFFLDMGVHVSIDDPSNPDALGFSTNQQGDAESDGTVVADNVPESFVFTNDIIFLIEVGGSGSIDPVEVTLDADDTTGNTDINDLIADIQAAITTANADLGSLITVGESGGNITLSLPTVDPTDLGFSMEQSSGGNLLAGADPTIIGSTTPQTIEFLLSVNGGIPQLVSVSTTPGDDTGGELTLLGLLGDINAALIAGVTAVTNGNRVELQAGGNSLEITRTLKLDAEEEITLEELQAGNLLDTEQDVNAAFEVDLTVVAKGGLEVFGTDDAYLPEGTIKVDINPFTETSSLPVDINTPDLERLSYELTDENGNQLDDQDNSDFADLLDFTVIGNNELVGLINQLGSWFDRLTETDLLNKFDIPFADADLGDFLDIKDIIKDALLYDDNDTPDEIDDIGRLLQKVGDDILPVFSTAQNLEVALANVLVAIGIYGNQGDALAAIDASYDPNSKDLTYNLNVEHAFVDIEVPIDFNLELGSLVDVYAEATIKLSGTGQFSAVMGVTLGDAAAAIDGDTLLEDLNGGFGVDINELPAITSADAVTPLIGRLSADATFFVTIIRGDDSQVVEEVQVTKNQTNDNITIDDLITDLNNSIQSAGLDGDIEATSENNRVVIQVKDGADVKHLQINSSSGNTAYSELGLQPETAATVFYVGDSEITKVDLDENILLEIQLNQNGVLSTFNVSILASATNGNNTIVDLLNDINDALNDAGLSEKIFATRQGSNIVLAAVDSSIDAFSVVLDGIPAQDAEAEAIGLQDAVAGVYVRAGSMVSSPFGILNGDANFTISLNGGSISDSITVLASNTENNNNVNQLIADINAEITALGNDLSGLIKAVNDGNRIRFESIDISVTEIEVTVPGGDAAITELGFETSQSADGDLRVIANKAAPVSFGVSEDTDFEVVITGGSLAGTYDVSLSAENTITNRSLYNLAGSLNTALNEAFGGSNNNPLSVTIQAGRLVFGLKTDSSGVPIANDITGFSIVTTSGQPAFDELHLRDLGGSETSTANNADFVIYTQVGDHHLVTLDGVTDIAGVLSAIDTATGGDVTATIGENNASIKLTDNTAGGNLFRVEVLNSSAAAIHLGIFGSDVTVLNLPQNAVGIAGADGVIEGTRIATVDLLERFFIRQLDSDTDFVSANVSVELIDPDGDGTAVEASAMFGFVGVKLTGGPLTLFEGNVGLGLADPNGKVTLANLFENLGSASSLLDLIELPTFDVETPESFELNIALEPDNLNNLISLDASPKLKFTLNDLGNLVSGVDGVSFSLPSIDVEGIDIDDLLSFQDIEFGDILAALAEIAEFLSQFSAFDFLSDEIPLLGISLNDFFDIAADFAQAIEDLQQNPAGGIQVLSQKLSEAFGIPNFADPAAQQAFFNSLGIPNPTDLIGFVLEDLNSDQLLRFDLRLPIGFNESLSVDLDLGDALGVDLGPVSIQGGAGLQVSGYLDAKLSFGINLADPSEIYLFTGDTGIEINLSAGAENITFNAAIGPLGAFIKDGFIDIDVTGSFAHETANPGDKVLITSIGSIFNGFTPTLTGELLATLPVYFPTESTFLGDIELNIAGANAISLSGSNGLQIPDLSNVLTLPDFSDIDLSNISLLDSLPLMIDALDTLLLGLQDILYGAMDINLPLIGDKLSAGADFIEDLREDVIDPIRTFVEQAPQKTQELVQELLYAILGPGNTGLTTLNDLLGISDGAINGLNLLKNFADGTPIGGIGDIDDIIKFEGLDEDLFLWQFRLGDTFSPDFAIDFDLGFPGLALDVDVPLDVNIVWDLALGIGISREDGVFIVIDNEREIDGFGTVSDELFVGISVEIEDGATLNGELAFLQLSITSISEEFDGDNDGNDPTHFAASFNIDLQNKNDANDERLSFFELGNLKPVIGLAAEAQVNFDIVAEFNKSLLGDTISAILPKLTTNFVLDWGVEITDLVAQGFELGGGLKLVEFQEVGIDMGSFIGDFLGPVVEKVQEITGPLQPIIDVVTTPIPVISDLAGRDITLVDLAATFGEIDPSLIYALADLITFVNSIPASPGSLVIVLGDFTIIDGNSSAGFKSNLTSPNFSLSEDSSDFSLASGLPSGFTDTLAGFQSLLDSAPTNGGNESTKNFSQGFLNGSATGAGGFAFPFLENPSEIFGLLMGRDIALITYDLAPFMMEFTYTQKFPIWGPLFARLSGTIGMTIDLAFGYDTFGVRQFADGGFTNPLKLLSGFFVSDTDIPSGTGGSDVPELILKGEIFAGAEINLGVASAGVEGGIILTVNFDLYDPDSDGRVRIEELVGSFLYEFRNGSPALAPIAIFDVYGDVAAQLRAFVEFLFFEKTFNITPPITLFEFSINFEREPILATERGDGSLLLNIGPNSESRLNGNTADIGETIFVADAGNGKVKVWSDQFGVSESAAQIYNANKIIAYGGEGNDTIDVSGTSLAVEIEGGTGNDIIRAGSGAAILRGDQGDDEIHGGSANDVIYGGEGNDVIHGGGGDDIIFGDEGSLITDPSTGEYTKLFSFSSDKDGRDTIYGDAGNDIIIGGGNFDTIYGNEGNDLILGDGGRFDFVNGQVPMANGLIDINAISDRDPGAGGKDIIFGNEGNDALFGGKNDDTIDGGAGQDQIVGGEGFDVLYGGSGADFIYGNEGDDVIFGYREPASTAQHYDASDNVDPDGDDYIEGNDGNDFIRGNGGDDEIYGGRGADIIFGDEGNDTIYGESGPDIIFGGADNDYIDASDGNDIVFGDDGLVVYLDFYDDVTATIDARKAVASTETGSLIRVTNEGHRLIGDGAESLIDGFELEDDGNPRTQDLIVTDVKATDGQDTVIGGAGDDIVLGGAEADTLYGDYDPANIPKGPLPVGKDVVIGDGGRIELKHRLYSTIHTISAVNDSDDVIFGNYANDILMGGGGNDTIYGLDNVTTQGEFNDIGISDEDVILGDNGQIDFTDGVVNKIFTTDDSDSTGGADVIMGNFDNDIILGGVNGSPAGQDQLSGNEGDDVILGDNGLLDFAYDGDTDLSTLDLILSTPYASDDTTVLGGADILSGDAGSDVLIGGSGGDFIYGDNPTASNTVNDGNDIILGDHAQIILNGTNGQRIVLGTAVKSIETIDDEEATGGNDTISGNAGDDVILGGVGGDTIYGDAAISTTIDGNDIILGDNGLLDFGYDGDTDLTVLDIIQSLPYASDNSVLGSVDTISGNRGGDVIIGGVAGDTIHGDDATASQTEFDGNDILLGDNGTILLNGTVGQLVILNSAVSQIFTTDDEDATGGVDLIEGNAGDDVILGGVFGDLLYGDAQAPSSQDGDDVILGDNGLLDYAYDDDTDQNTLDLIETNTYASDGTTVLGGDDFIFGNSGSDKAFGGSGADRIFGDNYESDPIGNPGVADGLGSSPGSDILIGDQGRILLTDNQPATIETTDLLETDGGADYIQGNDLGDIIIGGVAGDILIGEAELVDDKEVSDLVGVAGDDIIIGDEALIRYDVSDTEGIEGAGDNDLNTIDLIQTGDHTLGGNDTIYGNDGSDTAMGGAGNDTIYGDFYNGSLHTAPNPGNDTLIGDGGSITLLNENVSIIKTIDPSEGGFDEIHGNDLDDIIIGGAASDTLYGETEKDYLDLINEDQGGQDIILGDNGRLDYILLEDTIENRPDIEHVLGDNTVTLDPDADHSTLDRVMTTDPIHGGDDMIWGNANDDIIFGGTGKDIIWGDTEDGFTGHDGADGNDLIFGDHGKVFPTLPSENPDLFINNNFFSIDTQEADAGDDDLVFGNAGDDIILGQQGDDILFGGEDADDIIGGHNVVGGIDELDDMDSELIDAIKSGILANYNPTDLNDVNDVIDGGSGDDVLAGDNAIIIRQQDSASPRYQQLTEGSSMYSQITAELDGLFSVDIGFVPNITGNAQLRPGEENLGRTVVLLDHDESIQNNAADNPTDSRTFGNDVMAGGSDNDELFGQLGDDVMQGDGEILIQEDDTVVTFDPSPAVNNHSFTIPDDGGNYFEVFGNLLQFKVTENSTDGDDYIEGNGGNDRIYGNLGQDDIIGGSSILFGLNAETATIFNLGDVILRPDGADLIYGGSGERIDRNGYTDDIEARHARDADTILGDNGNIYRLVSDNAEYLTFNYDNLTDQGYSETLKIIPRAVELVDYGYEYTDLSDPTSLTFKADSIGVGDLIFGESGDDIIHGMTGDDVLFGNADDDDLYGEQGRDWISGGTGIDGILGDDGLIFTSRNDLNPESIYGIDALNPEQQNLKKNDEVDPNALNAVITTPGELQRAVINIEDALKKTVDLVAFEYAEGNDILFGGLQDDFIHSGGGDDAVSGAEALPFYYNGTGADFTEVNNLLKAQQNAPINPGPALADDPFWYHFAPYNPGDILRYEGNTDLSDPDGKSASEFALYDEDNPRRKIMLDANGEAVATEAEAVYDFILNFDETEGPLGFEYQADKIALPTDGDDRIFGDLGNDWIVGGTGRDHMYGGRGDDILNMDDNHNSGADGKPKPKDPPQNPLDNTASDEYQAYADIAYGGGGRDVLILNTGADRAIDWVGEFNSYLVPFSPFGAFHISRTLQPQLPEFLINLATSDGIDSTVPDGARYVEHYQQDDRVETPDPLRNGEPYGELGMTRQTDFDWQEQTGAPNDPQPGNNSGKREIMRREAETDESVDKSFEADANSLGDIEQNTLEEELYVFDESTGEFSVVQGQEESNEEENTEVVDETEEETNQTNHEQSAAHSSDGEEPTNHEQSAAHDEEESTNHEESSAHIDESDQEEEQPPQAPVNEESELEPELEVLISEETEPEQEPEPVEETNHEQSAAHSSDDEEPTQHEQSAAHSSEGEEPTNHEQSAAHEGNNGQNDEILEENGESHSSQDDSNDVDSNDQNDEKSNNKNKEKNGNNGNGNNGNGNNKVKTNEYDTLSWVFDEADGNLVDLENLEEVNQEANEEWVFVNL